jgi:hypothetical protein
MPQPQFRCPLQELDRGDKARREPAALAHVFCSKTLAPASFGPLRKVPERAVFNFATQRNGKTRLDSATRLARTRPA